MLEGLDSKEAEVLIALDVLQQIQLRRRGVIKNGII